jgi:hypothetical protein
MFLKIMMLGIVTQLCIHAYAGDVPVLHIDVTQEVQNDPDPLTTQNCLNAQFNINLGGCVGMLVGTVAGGIAVSLTNVALAPLYGACAGTVAVPLMLYTIGGIRYYYKKIYDEEKK